jgi:hypothetical protein
MPMMSATEHLALARQLELAAETTADSSARQQRHAMVDTYVMLARSLLLLEKSNKLLRDLDRRRPSPRRKQATSWE